jgi:hypothetical protein
LGRVDDRDRAEAEVPAVLRFQYRHVDQSSKERRMTQGTHGGIRAASLALACLVFGASFVYAARKIFDVTQVNQSVPVGDVFDLPAEMCGVSGPFGGDFVIHSRHVTLWDNGHYRVELLNSIRLVDWAGDPVLRDIYASHETGGTGGLPESYTLNIVSHCAPNTPLPGRTYQTHFTITFGEDGSIKQIHGAVCDPDAYPFC